MGNIERMREHARRYHSALSETVAAVITAAKPLPSEEGRQRFNSRKAIRYGAMGALIVAGVFSADAALSLGYSAAFEPESFDSVVSNLPAWTEITGKSSLIAACIGSAVSAVEDRFGIKIIS